MVLGQLDPALNICPDRVFLSFESDSVILMYKSTTSSMYKKSLNWFPLEHGNFLSNKHDFIVVGINSLKQLQKVNEMNNKKTLNPNQRSFVISKMKEIANNRILLPYKWKHNI